MKELIERLELEKILTEVADGRLNPATALTRLTDPPVVDLGHTKLDTLREYRSGVPEIIYGRGKSDQHLVEIVQASISAHNRVLVTRLTGEQLELLRPLFPMLEYFPMSGLAVCFGADPSLPGSVAVVSAGTSDAACAEEALISAQFLGLKATHVQDVGVAGLTRLLNAVPALREYDVLIAIAGMEGALPGVLAGLVEAPVIAVPTGVGYGATFGGLAALLTMLVSCSPGVTVVNIDNGFGAAVAAAKIVRHLKKQPA